MTTLYNCHHDGDQYRITKFNDLGEPESSYLCTEIECECPAGTRPTCRHRQMLPKFLARNAVDSYWFYDFDRGGWVTNEPANLRQALEDSAAPQALSSEPEIGSRSGLPGDNDLCTDEGCPQAGTDHVCIEPTGKLATEQTKPAWRRL